MLFEVVQREVPNRLRFSSPQKSQRRAKNFSNNFHIQMSTKGYIFSYIQTLDSLDFGFFLLVKYIIHIYIFKFDEFLAPGIFSFCAIGFHRPSKIWFIKKIIEFSIEVGLRVENFESRPRVVLSIECPQDSSNS
jgi:hypothetical protein